MLRFIALFLAVLALAGLPAQAGDLNAAATVSTNKILLQPYSVDPGFVTTAATPTATDVTLTGLPSGGVCELYVLNLGGADVQIGINGTVPTSTAGDMYVPAGCWGLLQTNTPATSLKTHAKSGSNSCAIGW